MYIVMFAADADDDDDDDGCGYTHQSVNQSNV